MSEKTQTTIRIDTELYAHLGMVAEARGESVNTAIVNAIQSYVTKGRRDPKVKSQVEAKLRSFLES